MSLASKTIASARHDFARSRTPGRLSTLVVLALFPPAMMAINVIAGDATEAAPAIIGVTVLMVGMLALFLWATPIVHQELEGKTWTYIAVRPQGKLALLFGKYIVAVGWAMSVCLIALTLSVIVLALADSLTDHIKMWLVFSFVIFLAAFAYGAVYLFLGVIFHRRAMVMAVIYSIGFEGIMANIPAVVNQFTIRHHLTALSIKWLNVPVAREGDPMADLMFGIKEPDLQNIGMVVAVTLVSLGATVAIIRNREYITSDEN